MRFWDSSAVVPLLVRQPETDGLLRLLAADGSGVLWWGTPVECWSALSRLRREGLLDSQDDATARDLLGEVVTHWAEVLASDGVRRQSDLLLRRHPLRAAAALQLAAALVFFGSEGGEFVTLDGRLAEAAEKEGLTVRTAGRSNAGGMSGPG